MNDATLALLEAVLTLVIGIGGAILIPKLREISNQKIGVANTNMILTWADTAVKMAEQKLGSGTGNAKFDLAMAVLQGASNWNNFKVDEKTLEAAIEAAVLRLQTVKPAAPANLEVAAPVTAPASPDLLALAGAAHA